jgi:hypothetical protein
LKHSGWVQLRQTARNKARFSMLTFFCAKGQADITTELHHNQ